MSFTESVRFIMGRPVKANRDVNSNRYRSVEIGQVRQNSICGHARII